jgi:cytochrome c553
VHAAQVERNPPLMKGVVEKLSNDDIVAISAFAASLEP